MGWSGIRYVTAGVALATASNAPQAVLAEAEATLDGLQQVPSVHTNAKGNFHAQVRSRTNEIAFTLSYADVETAVRFAHIHFAERRVNGSIVVWLCDNTHNAPIDVAPCPQRQGTVEGVISPIELSGAPGQGIDAGEFDALIEVIHAGATYVDIHSTAFPEGEIRGQIEGR